MSGSFSFDCHKTKFSCCFHKSQWMINLKSLQSWLPTNVSVPPVVSVRTYYAKAADSGSQLWLEKLQLQISGGSACAHPQGTLAWSCSYLQDSLVSAAESHLSPFPVQWLHAHEEYFPLTDVGSETSLPCVCSVNPLVHCQEEYFCQQISNQPILKLLIKMNLESSRHNN